MLIFSADGFGRLVVTGFNGSRGGGNVVRLQMHSGIHPVHATVASGPGTLTVGRGGRICRVNHIMFANAGLGHTTARWGIYKFSVEKFMRGEEMYKITII